MGASSDGSFFTSILVPCTALGKFSLHVSVRTGLAMLHAADCSSPLIQSYREDWIGIKMQRKRIDADNGREKGTVGNPFSLCFSTRNAKDATNSAGVKAWLNRRRVTEFAKRAEVVVLTLRAH